MKGVGTHIPDPTRLAPEWGQMGGAASDQASDRVQYRKVRFFGFESANDATNL